MNNRQLFVFIMFFVISIAFMLMFFESSKPACVKIDSDVFFTESLRIYSNGAVNFEVDNKKFYSNNATYFYVENEEDCEIIREIFD